LVLPTSTELATGSWVVVRRDNEWLDRRFLNSAYSRLQADDVDEWTEPTMQLERLVSAGEGPNSEFKATEPADKLKLMKTVAAFSNGSGGSILIGVRDDGEVVGVSAEVANAGGRDRLANLIRNWTLPLPIFEIDAIETRGGLQVIIIKVAKGPLPPYGAGTSAETLQYFVRRGATTFAAAPDQIRDMARSTPPVSSGGNTLLL
jgi:ATP-dependent DNA helicase RecG